ncbi:tetratricopeptide repeat-containing sulfotransferase family protein [Emcibacter nanhaiensis]|uniref:Tetratricopeptide repeat protein n=1 Tax=Emcibacter nanhaiensis TaxID=1505037 RepID=A0A501PFI8_9PROT|nr:tetratricopeptide repeat-containing sulfotransferase family protein [Emcibacter nanhaiensis]TPD58908.1 tetratricopeptide repeat protein [Emcibacter nanhaiensis]
MTNGFTSRYVASWKTWKEPSIIDSQAQIAREIQLARQLAGSGRVEAAITKLEALLGAGEQAEHLLWPLAELYISQGRYDEAIGRYEEYLQLFPKKPAVEYNLAYLLRKHQRFEPAVLHYQRALELGIDRPEEVYLNIGVIFSDYLRKEGEARQALLKALQISPEYIPALYNLANLDEQEGRLPEAAKLFEKILRLDPTYFEALARLADLHRFENANDALIGKLRDAAKSGRMDPSTRINLLFSLGKALNDCGVYDEAFASYRMANDLDRRNLPVYDRDATEKYVDDIIDVFSSDWFASLPEISDAEPVFICGMFRSGSTLTEQILASHPRVTAGGEIEYFLKAVHGDLKPFPQSVRALPMAQLSQMAGGYLQVLENNFPGHDMVTDKRPDNILCIGLIKSLFPKARILFTRRNPLDNCLSVYFMRLGPLMNYATDLGNIAHYYKQCDRLWRHWQGLFPATTHEVNYDELVETPEAVTRKLVDVCGLEWDEKCLEFHKLENVVKTGSVLQVRQPLYKSSSGRWRHYDPWLGSLKKIFHK